MEIIPEETTIQAKTLNAVQRNWQTPSEFPCCPQEYGEEPITVYAENLKTGSIFFHNKLYSAIVLKRAMSKDHQSLYVISESQNAVKPWALAKITYENGLFVHETVDTFFTQIGAEKQFCRSQGVEWTGDDSIDDYC